MPLQGGKNDKKIFFAKHNWEKQVIYKMMTLNTKMDIQVSVYKNLPYMFGD